MTYSESWPTKATMAQVIRELSRHGQSIDELHADGIKPNCDGMYSSARVLAWLGY